MIPNICTQGLTPAEDMSPAIDILNVLKAISGRLSPTAISKTSLRTHPRWTTVATQSSQAILHRSSAERSSFL